MGRNITTMPVAVNNVISPSHQMSAASLPRASYAIISANSANTIDETAFLDAEFRAIAPYNTGPVGAGQATGGGASASFDRFLLPYKDHGQTSGAYNGAPTQTQASSNGTTSAWVNATNNSGEFGNDNTWVSERGLQGNTVQRAGTNTVMAQTNFSFINSDHKDRSVVLTLNGGQVSLTSRWRPTPPTLLALQKSKTRTKSISSQFGAGSQIASQFGSASYNNVRKEFVTVAYNTSVAGQYDVKIWKNMNFDAVDVTALGVPDVAQTVNMNTVGGWGSNTTESQYRVTPVLVDTGDIYLVAFFPSAAIRLFKMVRTGGDTTNTFTLLDSLSTTTSYGLEQGNDYGMKTMQSRNGQLVICFCPYYYYGTGIESFVVDKRNSSWARGFQYALSSGGCQVLPYGDDGFANWFAGNFYASNNQGGYIQGFVTPGVLTGAPPVWTNANLYLPIAPAPNTTNYPGMSQVWEFALQSELPY